MLVPIHVLHVEDNPEFASMTETWVERRSEAIRISREASPNDALDRLADHRPVERIVRALSLIHH